MDNRALDFQSHSLPLHRNPPTLRAAQASYQNSPQKTSQLSIFSNGLTFPLDGWFREISDMWPGKQTQYVQINQLNSYPTMQAMP